MFWFIVLGYFLLAIFTGTLLRHQGVDDGSVFYGSSATDYAFLGFISIFWPVILPFVFVGFAASFISRRIKKDES